MLPMSVSRLDLEVPTDCSVLMDHVPKRHRGKVNALDSVRTFSWSEPVRLLAGEHIYIVHIGLQATIQE